MVLSELHDEQETLVPYRDSRGANVIHYLSRYNSYKLVPVLANIYKKDWISLVNQEDEEGNTPLMWSANKNMFSSLIAYGANPFKLGRCNRNALFHMYTMFKEPFTFAKKLKIGINCPIDEKFNSVVHYYVSFYYETKEKLKRDLDDLKKQLKSDVLFYSLMNVPNLDGFTPFLHAVNLGKDVGTLELLIEFGADVHAKDKDGNSALHLCRALDTAKMLLDKGLDIQQENMHHKTPLDVAIDKKLWPLVRYYVLERKVKLNKLQLALVDDNLRAEVNKRNKHLVGLKRWQQMVREGNFEPIVEAMKEIGAPVPDDLSRLNLDDAVDDYINKFKIDNNVYEDFFGEPIYNYTDDQIYTLKVKEGCIYRYTYVDLYNHLRSSVRNTFPGPEIPISEDERNNIEEQMVKLTQLNRLGKKKLFVYLQEPADGTVYINDSECYAIRLALMLGIKDYSILMSIECNKMNNIVELLSRLRVDVRQLKGSIPNVESFLAVLYKMAQKDERVKCIRYIL
jgi:ankyrin repeat protein